MFLGGRNKHLVILDLYYVKIIVHFLCVLLVSPWPSYCLNIRTFECCTNIIPLLFTKTDIHIAWIYG